VGTLTADGSSDNTGTSAIVHRPTAHATEATWRAFLVSPLAASASATVASVCACQSGLVIERATVALVPHLHAPGHLLQRHPPADGNRRAARQSPGISTGD
jgi:hypothetical protein